MTLTNLISALPTHHLIAPPKDHVISTEATDRFTVRCAVESPLYFAAAVARSTLSLKAVILSEGAAESKDLRLPGAAFSQRSESQPPQVNA